MPLSKERIREIIGNNSNVFELSGSDIKQMAKIFDVERGVVQEIVEDMRLSFLEAKEDKEDEDRYIENAQKQLATALANIDKLRQAGELKKYKSIYAKMMEEDPAKALQMIRERGGGVKVRSANTDPTKDISAAYADYQKSREGDLWANIKKIVEDEENKSK